MMCAVVVSLNLRRTKLTCKYVLAKFGVLALEHMLVSRPQATPRIARKTCHESKKNPTTRNVLFKCSLAQTVRMSIPPWAQVTVLAAECVHRMRTQFFGSVPSKVHHHWMCCSSALEGRCPLALGCTCEEDRVTQTVTFTCQKSVLCLCVGRVSTGVW